MKNCIKIKQLEVFAYHGCEEQEKINGQKFYIDANLYTDISVAGNTDDLNETVNYAEVCDFINKFLTKWEKKNFLGDLEELKNTRRFL